MCIKIFYSKKIVEYNPEKNLENQLKGCKKIIIDYDPKDTNIDKFVDEIERLCDRGNSVGINIDIIHNNFIEGAKTKKRIEKTEINTQVNALIKMMVIGYSEADKKLEQLKTICSLNNKDKG